MTSRLICRICLQRKWEDEFPRHEASSSGRLSYCSACNRERVRIYRESKRVYEQLDRDIRRINEIMNRRPDDWDELVEQARGLGEEVLYTPVQKEKDE